MFSREVQIPAGPVGLPGLLTVPEGSHKTVIFVHGSGSSRLSPRNRFVSEFLNAAGLATLLFDLLTPSEESDRTNVFDIKLLSHRLHVVTAWLRATAYATELIGYFGASTGAAAALSAAADRKSDIFAIVSRGGRPDLAASKLRAVRAPTLLIVGGRDEVVLSLNRAALAELHCSAELAIVREATHLFQEPGALEAVAEHAREWFVRWPLNP